jgi:hypothetical protein
MVNSLEKNKACSETKKKLENSIISHVISIAAPNIFENCAKKGFITDGDIGQEVRRLMDGYRDAPIATKIMSYKEYQDWDAFVDHVYNSVVRFVRNNEKNKKTSDNVPPESFKTEKPEELSSEDTTPLRSENLKQKKLF